MLSCLMKLAMLLCLKNFGRISFAKRCSSSTRKLVPSWKQRKHHTHSQNCMSFYSTHPTHNRSSVMYHALTMMNMTCHYQDLGKGTSLGQRSSVTSIIAMLKSCDGTCHLRMYIFR